MSSHQRRQALRVALTLSAVALTLAAATWFRTQAPRAAGHGLLAPIARMAAGMEWVRAERALSRGEVQLGLARAEHALTLSPQSTALWSLLAHYQALTRSSPQSELDPARRRAWFRAGLETLRRGREHAEEPQDLALLEGLLLAQASERDSELNWPGGDKALWKAALAAFEQAQELGHPIAKDMAFEARAALEQLDL